ncbi:MAG: hypothetical protein PHI66_02270 [Candidatus Pacebacteria bacterium]|nr:hypothetical protein [Candidatus Paceibacterota bacterium]
MNEKDQIILEDSVDAVISTIPQIGMVWGLCTALFGSAVKLRQKKALEWVEMIRDNPYIFTQELLKNEIFQDGFVCALEKYIVERNEEKRKCFRNIFLGFSISGDKQGFPLEKFIHTLSQLSEIDIEVLCDARVTRENKDYQIYGNKDYRISNIHNLINLGILGNDPSSRLGPLNAPFVWVSEFGKEFVKYIEDEK